jgi:hypothetical protein
MQLTIVRDRGGNIIGAVFGHVAHQPPDQRGTGDQAGPMAVEGQTFEHVTAPEEFGQLHHDPREFGRRLKAFSQISRSSAFRMAIGYVGLPRLLW